MLFTALHMRAEKSSSVFCVNQLIQMEVIDMI